MSEHQMSPIRAEAIRLLQKPNVLSHAKSLMDRGAYTNYLMQAVKSDAELGEAKWAEMVNAGKENGIVKAIMKQGLLSDVASALGVMSDIVIDAVQSMAVAREIIPVIPVTKTQVRFFLRSRGKVWDMGDGPNIVTPGRHDYVDIDVNKEKGTDALFSKSYLEDVPYDVLAKEVGESGQLLEEYFTGDVLDVYEALRTATNEVSSAADVIAWADVVDVWTKLKTLGGKGKAFLCSPTVVGDLFKDDKFIHQFYFGSLIDVAKGVLGTTYLGFKIVETDLIGTLGTAATADDPMLIDTSRAAAAIMRRDITTEPYKEKLMEGSISTMRYGVKALDGTKGLAWIDRTG